MVSPGDGPVHDELDEAQMWVEEADVPDVEDEKRQQVCPLFVLDAQLKQLKRFYIIMQINGVFLCVMTMLRSSRDDALNYVESS